MAAHFTLLRPLRLSSVLFLFIFYSVSAKETYQNQSPLQQVCRPLKDPVFCVKTLQSIPRSAKHPFDAPRLAMVAAELAVGNATETQFYLAWLLKNVTDVPDPLRDEAIENCGKAYSAAAVGLGETLMDVARGSYEAAYFRTQPGEEPDKCKKVFGDKGLAYPPELGRRGDMVKKLYDLAHDLIYWYLVNI